MSDDLGSRHLIAGASDIQSELGPKTLFAPTYSSIL